MEGVATSGADRRVLLVAATNRPEVMATMNMTRHRAAAEPCPTLTVSTYCSVVLTLLNTLSLDPILTLTTTTAPTSNITFYSATAGAGRGGTAAAAEAALHPAALRGRPPPDAGPGPQCVRNLR